VAGVHLIALTAAVITIAVMVELLRRRQLRQKYALMWVLVGLVVAVIAITPGTFNHVAHRLGVISPPDLLVVLAALFLLLVCVHLSWELGRLEDRSRRLAEELALVRKEVEDLSRPPGTTASKEQLSHEPGDAGGRRQPTP
jgi:hypothetical protein